MDERSVRSDEQRAWIDASPAQVFAALRDPARVARWWGPAGFSNTIHRFDCWPGGAWHLTMHGPDGREYPNESRFVRLIEPELWEIEHFTGHHFVLTVSLRALDGGTEVCWTQTFDSAAHFAEIAAFVRPANTQNLHRLRAEVAAGG